MSESRTAAIDQVATALQNAGLLDFSGEVQLLEWSKSSSRDGPKIKLLLQDDDAVSPFESATIKKGKQAGQLYHVFAIRVDEDDLVRSTTPAAPDQPRPRNRLAQHMHRIGYFNNPKLWAALHELGIYTQDDHKAWIEAQPCHGSTTKLDDYACSGEVCAHHCNSAANPAAGHDTRNPQKPPHWFCLPMCHGHHTVYCHSSVGANRQQKADMREAAVALTAARVKEAFKEHYGMESLSEITHKRLNDFETFAGLQLTPPPT